MHRRLTSGTVPVPYPIEQRASESSRAADLLFIQAWENGRVQRANGGTSRGSRSAVRNACNGG